MRPGYNKEPNYESTAQVGLFGVRLRLFLKRRNPNAETTVEKHSKPLISRVGGIELRGERRVKGGITILAMTHRSA
jgi:hypothetical protein